jgi:hypothetical protein
LNASVALIALLAAVNPIMPQAVTQPSQVTSPTTRPTPPTRDPNTPGFVTAKELPDGTVPPIDADGNFIIGPTHAPAFEMIAHEGVPRGTVHTFTMSSADRKIFPGIARDSGTFGTPSPTDPATLDTQANPDWIEPFPPFHIAGNLYYVGSKGLASYLVTTPRGHILINSDLETSVPLIRASVEKLGFKFRDIKILLISHAHWDHDGGSAEIKRLTGATYMVMDRDVSVVESGGKTDFQYGNTPASLYPPQRSIAFCARARK